MQEESSSFTQSEFKLQKTFSSRIEEARSLENQQDPDLDRSVCMCPLEFDKPTISQTLETMPGSRPILISEQIGSDRNNAIFVQTPSSSIPKQSDDIKALPTESLQKETEDIVDKMKKEVYFAVIEPILTMINSKMTDAKGCQVLSQQTNTIRGYFLNNSGSIWHLKDYLSQQQQQDSLPQCIVVQEDRIRRIYEKQRIRLQSQTKQSQQKKWNAIQAILKKSHSKLQSYQNILKEYHSITQKLVTGLGQVKVIQLLIKNVDGDQSPFNEPIVLNPRPIQRSQVENINRELQALKQLLAKPMDRTDHRREGRDRAAFADAQTDQEYRQVVANVAGPSQT